MADGGSPAARGLAVMWRCVQRLRRDAFVPQGAPRQRQEGASKVVAKRFMAETLAAATCCP